MLAWPRSHQIHILNSYSSANCCFFYKTRRPCSSTWIDTVVSFFTKIYTFCIAIEHRADSSLFYTCWISLICGNRTYIADDNTMKTNIFRCFMILLAIVGVTTLFFCNYLSVNFEFLGQEATRTIPETLCKFPKLLVDDPLIKPYLKTYSPLECSKEKNWVFTVGDGRFYISEDAVRHNGKIECNYSRIDRISDWKYKEIDLGFLVNGTEFNGDTFRVICHAVDDKKYDVLHVAVPNPNKEIQERIQANWEKLSGRKLDLNVMIYLMDSISRMNFIRHCPKFHALLTEKMGAYVMEGFNIVGDGTPWAIIPMTTGHFQTELPEARKRFNNASYLDDWPLIFKNFSSAGYVTSFAEEEPQYGAFNYKLKGFNATPVDHYLRTFLLADSDHRSKVYPHCVGDTPKSIILCKFWREMQIMYRSTGGRHFSMLFSSELSHDDYNTVQVLDEHWINYFGQLFEEGFFNDTLLLVMGDHGRRFGSIRQTQSGKLEEKLPFLAVVFPPWFKHRFPKSHANLIKNQHRLITVFDLHETFLHLLNFDQDGGLGNLKNRGISLFQEIPFQRTCAHAHINAHFCSCLDWITLEEADKNPIVLQAAQKVIDYFNQEIQEVPDRCANLSLAKVVWARVLKPKDQLMAFKESIDFDNYVQDLTDNSTSQADVYQFRFITKPGGGDFEASVSYFVKEKQFLMDNSDISRLNAYHNQAQCVINTHGHLRTFCYCV